MRLDCRCGVLAVESVVWLASVEACSPDCFMDIPLASTLLDESTQSIHLKALTACQRSFNWQSTAFVMRGLGVRLPPLAFHRLGELETWDSGLGCFGRLRELRKQERAAFTEKEVGARGRIGSGTRPFPIVGWPWTAAPGPGTGGREAER